MFKFGFSGNEEEIQSEDLTKENLKWIDCEEIVSNFKDVETIIEIAKEENEILSFKDFDIEYISPSFSLVETLKEGDESCVIGDAEHAHSDLLPAKYEGGLKLWEGTTDLASFLKSTDCEEKNVLDLGCGTGLLGILTKKLGAKSVTFQDYNSTVLKYSTIPNVHLNKLESCKFYSGDWGSFSEAIGSVRFDLVVTSETVYNNDNFYKLCNIFKTHLEPNGTILLAGKSCYFGVGGGTLKFMEYLDQLAIFNYELVWQFTTGVKRDILKIKLKS